MSFRWVGPCSRCVVMYLLVGLPCRAVVFTVDTTIASGDTTYDGHVLVVSNCTLTVHGAHMFGDAEVLGETGEIDCQGTSTLASLLVREDAAFRLRGGYAVHVSGVVTVRSNATVIVEGTNHTAQVAGAWQGAGGTITAGTMIVDNGGRISADGYGYIASAGPGVDVTDDHGGGSHGGQGNQNAGFRYGSARFPVALGSGGSHVWGAPGGGAIRLDIVGTLTLDGEVSADGLHSSSYDGGAGGSIWVTAGALSGSGVFTANGGYGWANRDGGGGRIAIYSDNLGGFAGFSGSTAAGDDAAQRGTVAFYDAAGDDLTVYDHFIFEGSITTDYHSVSLKHGSTVLMNGGATLDVADTLGIESNAVLRVLSTNHTVQVEGQWIGRGGEISALTVTVEAGGHITANGDGYGAGAGPGADGTDDLGGGSHGGTGSENAGFRYGSARFPVALGSGGSHVWGAPGGGAIRLDVAGTLTLDGEVSADGFNSSSYDGGAGGSIWVTAGTVSGSGVFTANGGYGWADRDGGGGRIAVYSDNLGGFAGFSGSTADGDNTAQRGTVAFYDAAGDDLTVYDHFIFEGAVTTGYHSVSLENGSTALMNGGATLDVADTLRIESNAVLRVLSTNHTVQVEGQWVGRGGEISALTVTVETGGRITADGDGYGAGAGPGADGTDDLGGGSHGGQGNQNAGFRYGSARFPVALGSGGSHVWGAPGGGAIRLAINGTLTLDGEVSADGLHSSSYDGGAGGSIWVTAGALSGSGVFTANGGGGWANRDGGGGRIAVYSGDVNGFYGFSASTAAGDNTAQRGTVAFYDAAGDDLAVYDHFIFEGAVTTEYHTVSLKNGSTTLMNGGAALDVTETLRIESNAVLRVLSTNHTAQVEGQWIGRGGEITAGTLIVEAGGWIAADGDGYAAAAGPGVDVTDNNGGGSHGGQGSHNAGFRYGSARFPLALGSGGSHAASGAGGGAIRLMVAGPMSLEGAISADGSNSSSYGGGAGGSIWVTAGALSGSGVFTANAGYGWADRDGGGGRIAVYSDDLSGFDGFAGSTANGDNTGERGTVAYFSATGDELLVYDHFIFEGSVTTDYRSVTLKSGSTALMNGEAMLDVADTLHVESNAVIHVRSIHHAEADDGLWRGRGGVIRAAHLVLEQDALITADGYGYRPGQGPGIDVDDGGGSHGGQGNGGGPRHGLFRTPTDLGSGGTHPWGAPGGGAIRLDVTGTLTLEGEISADGLYSSSYDGGAGGSIWVTAGTLAGSGVLTANGGGGWTNRDGGGGRIAVYTDDTVGFDGFYRAEALGDSAGEDGTVGFFDASGAQLDVYQHFVFDPETTPAFESLTLHSNSVVQLYGGASLTVTNDARLESNAVVLVHSLDRDGPVFGAWQGIGATLYAAELTIEAGGGISADGSGYRAGTGPGADEDEYGGGSHGGRGVAGADPYGSEYAPAYLGSGGAHPWGGPGGGAVRLVVPDTFILDGFVRANGLNSSSYDGGSGGAVWIETGNFQGDGLVSVNGGSGWANRDGGGGRIAVYAWSTMTFAETNLVAVGDTAAESGTVFLASEPRFVWLQPTSPWAYDTIPLEWAGAGLDPRDVQTDIVVSGGGARYTIASGLPGSGRVVWDTRPVADGNYTLEAVFRTLAGDYRGVATRDLRINNSAAWHGGAIVADETWTDDSVHVIDRDLVITHGATLVIEPGAVVKLIRDARITVADGGILSAAGTQDGFVVFSSLADDTAGGDTNLDADRSLPQPGHWAGVTIEGTGVFVSNDQTELRYVRMSHAGTLASQETWSGTFAHEITDDVIVPPGATLIIEPGAVVKLDTLRRIRVQAGGTLIAHGESARPITFTSLKDDSVGGDLNGDGDTSVPGPGDWWGLYGEGGAIRLSHAVVAYGGGHASGAPSEASAIRCAAGSDVVVENCLVTEAFYDGILGWDTGSLRVVNTVVENCDRGINVHGTQVYGDIVNCTLVNNRIGLWIWNGFLDMDNTVISHSHEAGVHISAYPTQDDMHYCNVWSPTGLGFQNMADPTGMNGMISADPGYRSFAGGNYRLTYGSPCIDAGQSLEAPASDKMGAPRYDDPRTDNTGVPDGQGAVADLGAYEFVEGADSDLDLVVTDVRGPATITAGADVEVAWTVRNIGTARAQGSWHDRIRLTPVSPGRWSAPQIAGEALVTASLGPNQEATFTTTVRVPGGTEGDWRWEVRANVDGAIFEGLHWNNNTSEAQAVSVLRVPSVAEGAAIEGMYPGEDLPAWYKVDLAAAQEVIAAVDSGMASGRCRLYAGYGAMPTESYFDARSAAWNTPDVQLALAADAEPVTAYLMLVPERIGDADPTYSLTIETAAFALDGTGLDRAGNAGEITVPLYGSRFRVGMTALLRPDAGGDIAAHSLRVLDATTALATFDLGFAAIGPFDVVVAIDGLERALEDGFTVHPGVGGRLETRVVMPAAVRAGRVFTGYVEYRNVGDANLAAPLLTIQGVGGDVNVWATGSHNSSNTSFNVLAVAQDSPLPSVLPPGSTYSVAFHAFETIDPEIVVRVSAVKTLETQPLDYAEIEDAMRPAEPCALWSNLWREVTDRGGVTRGEYVSMLGTAADRARGYGLDLSTEWDLLQFVIWEAREDIKPSRVAGTLYRETTENPIARCVVTLAATNQYSSTLATNDIHSAQTWYDGRFGFVDVPPGTYVLSAKGYLPGSLLTIDLPDPVGSPVTGLTVFAESRAGAVHGYVSDGSGGPPVAGLTVTAQNRDTGRFFLAPTDSYGYYIIHSLEPAPYRVRVETPGWLPESPLEVTLDAGDTRLVSFALSRTGGGIGGIVRDAAGSAVSHAIVRLSFLDAAAGAWSGGTTTSDDAGVYAFAALPPGRYDLAAAASGHGSSERVRIRVNGYDDAQTVDLLLADAHALAGTVVAAAGGAPIEGAVVSLNAYPAPLAGATTDAAGAFVFEHLAAGTYEVFAEAPGYDTTRASVTVPGDTPALALVQRGLVAGIVRSGTNVMAGIEISVISLSKGVDWTTTTDDHGTYRIENLHPGAYAVVLGGSSGRSLAYREIDISASQPAVSSDFQLHSSLLSGTVYGPDGGTPMANAQVSLVFLDDVVAQAWTDDLGGYAFLVHEPGSFTVLAAGPDGLAAPLPPILVETNDTVSALDLTAGANSLACLVTDSAGLPVGDARVLLLSLADATSNALFEVAYTAPDGSCTLEGIADGTYRLRVSAEGFAPVERELILPGAGPQTVALPVGRIVQGRVTSAAVGGAPAAGAWVSAGNAYWGLIAGAVTDADGQFRFDSLPRAALEIAALESVTQEAATAWVDTQSLAIQTLDLQLGPPASTAVSGSVINHAGHPVIGARVALLNGAGAAVATDLSDQQGAYRMAGWPTGSYSLEAWAPGYVPEPVLLVATTSVDIVGQDLLLTGPIAEWSTGAVIHAPGPESARGSGVSGYAPDFLTYDFWRDVLSGDYGLQPPSYFNNQLGGDRLVDRWRSYFFGLPTETHAYCYKVEAAGKKCSAADDRVFETYMKFTEDWDILKEVNQANVGIVASQSALIAARLIKLRATTADLRGYVANPGLQSVGPKTLESISSGIETLFNLIGLARTALSQGNLSDLGSRVTSLDETAKLIQKLAKDIEGFSHYSTLSETITIINDVLALVDDYKNLDNDARQRFEQYTADVNAYVDAVKNLHRAFHELKQAVALCNNPDEEEPTDDDPPPPDNEGEGTDGDDDDGDPGGDGDGGPTGGTPWDPDDDGWNPPPTPGGTPPAPGGGDGGSGGEGGSSGGSSVLGSRDPNDKLTVGFGPAGYIGPDTVLHYTIRFENMTNATLAAFRVTVTDTLSTDLDWSTFAFEDLRFNNVTVAVPPALQRYENDGVTVPNDPNPVEIEAVLDPDTGTVTWRMESVDPVTGGLPEDPFAGFLPPNTNAPAGEGYVKFAIQVRPDAWDTLAVTNTADIVFDYNETIATPPVTNTIDRTPPASAVATLGLTSPPTFTVQWAGSDGPGAGIVSYDVYVARENTAPQLWLGGATNTQASYTGEPGVRYGFYSVARDGVGLAESTPAGPDTVTRIAYHVTTINPTTNELVVQWESAAGKTYRVLMGTDLLTPLTAIATGVPATPPLNSFTTRTERAREEFYGIELE